MKNIQTPGCRPRTDGVQFKPPPSAHNFQLPTTRFQDAPLTSTLTYTLDERDHEFLEMCQANNITGDSVNAPITPRILVALMSAFEIEAYRKLMFKYNDHQRQVQLQKELEQQQQSTAGGGNNNSKPSSFASASNANSHEVAGFQQQQKNNNKNSNNNNSAQLDPSSITGALNASSQIISSPNMPGVLEEIEIKIPDVLRAAAAANSKSNGNNDKKSANNNNDDPLLKHPAVTDPKVTERIHQSVRGHWLEKRRATGNALMSVYRPQPYLNGVFGNKVIGQGDEPFSCREISNPLVTWRPPKMDTKNNNNNFIATTTVDGGDASSKSAASFLSEKQKQKLNTEMDREKMLRYLKNAVGTMRAVVEREELRLAHAETLVTELAIGRKCRQLQSGVLSSREAMVEAAIRKEKKCSEATGDGNDDGVGEDASVTRNPEEELCAVIDASNGGGHHGRKQQHASISETLLTHREKEMMATLFEALPVPQ